MRRGGGGASACELTAAGAGVGHIPVIAVRGAGHDALARVILKDPRILVLDEATEGLAPLIREEIWQALNVLKAEGLSQIVIDKNIKALLKFADRHFVLEKGHVVWQGDSQQLSDSPALINQYLGV